MLTISVILLFAGGVLATDYCNLESCQGRKHIGCNNNGQFYASCPSDAKLVEFNDELKAYILDAHNKLRNKVASGKESGYPASTQMATMVWDDEMAQLAQLNVMQCKMNHDACRSTDAFPYSGQNLASAAKTNAFYTPKEMIDSGVTAQWYGEIKKASPNDIANCCDNGSILHFTQVIWGKATAIGCAISQYTEGKWKKSILACNYAIGNVQTQAVYKSGKTASECSSNNSQYPGLCAPGDSKIDPTG